MYCTRTFGGRWNLNIKWQRNKWTTRFKSKSQAILHIKLTQMKLIKRSSVLHKNISARFCVYAWTLSTIGHFFYVKPSLSILICHWEDILFSFWSLMVHPRHSSSSPQPQFERQELLATSCKRLAEADVNIFETFKVLSWRNLFWSRCTELKSPIPKSFCKWTLNLSAVSKWKLSPCRVIWPSEVLTHGASYVLNRKDLFREYKYKDSVCIWDTYWVEVSL